MNFQPDQNKYKYNKEIEKVSCMLGIIFYLIISSLAMFYIFSSSEATP